MIINNSRIVNHWGIYVDPLVPITGVITNNEAVYNETSNGIDLQFEEHKLDCTKENHYDCYYDEWTESGDYLIGSWIMNSEGLYEPDRSGEYSAIVRDTDTQVEWSRYTTKCALCSPCYPGQGDLDSSGEFLAYTLPPDMLDEPTKVIYHPSAIVALGGGI